VAEFPAPTGRPKVIDDDMLTFAVALKGKGVPRPRDREEADDQDREERGRLGSRPSPIRS
jgi:hypothetical protein